jgi:hypothetical protein
VLVDGNRVGGPKGNVIGPEGSARRELLYCLTGPLLFLCPEWHHSYVTTLSASAVTGLFTLAGTLAGGMFPFVAETLKRRWQRRDTAETVSRERRATLKAERKAIYSQLLAKGVEIDYVTGNTMFARLTGQEQASISGKDMSAVLGSAWPSVAILFREFQNLRTSVELIAEENVQDLIREWDAYLSRSYWAVQAGGQPADDDPYQRLVCAMKDELFAD